MRQLLQANDDLVKTVAIINPLKGATVSGVIDIRATATSETDVRIFIDSIEIEDVQLANGAWIAAGVNTNSFPNGAHTITATAAYIDSTTSSTVITVTFNNVTDGGGTPDGPTDALIYISNPAPTVAKLSSSNIYKTATVSGSSFYIETYVDAAVGTISKVQFQKGHVDRGLLPAARVGSSRIWRATTAWNTIDYQADDQNASTLADIGVFIRAKITLTNGSVKYSEFVYTQTNNSSYRGVTPVWKTKHAWTVPYTNKTAFVNYYLAYDADNEAGSLYGKEGAATTIVTDPVSAGGTNGHVSHGNVVLADVRDDYAATTAGQPRTYQTGNYGTKGDQPPSGGLRWQAASRENIDEGSEIWCGFAFRIGDNFPTPTSSHISIAQIMGDPYEYGIALMLEARTKTAASGVSDDVINQFRYFGGRLNPGDPSLAFKMPFHRGKWVDVVFGVGFSRDIRKGWLEIHTRQPGTTVLTPYEFFGIPGLTRIPRVMLPKNSVGHSIHQHVYRAQGKWDYVPVHFAKQKQGPNAASVDPHSYA
jgi:hypothetical protein